MFFDNRKAGKSTPITWQGLRFLLGQWCGLFTSLLENRAILWKKRRLSQLFEDCDVESLQPIPGWF